MGLLCKYHKNRPRPGNDYSTEGGTLKGDRLALEGEW